MATKSRVPTDPTPAELKHMGDMLMKFGTHGDTILAHINPKEAAVLKAMGGDGTRNVMTGLLQYEDVDGGGDHGGSGTGSGDSSGSGGAVGGDAGGGQAAGGGDVNGNSGSTADNPGGTADGAYGAGISSPGPENSPGGVPGNAVDVSGGPSGFDGPSQTGGAEAGPAPNPAPVTALLPTPVVGVSPLTIPEVAQEADARTLRRAASRNPRTNRADLMITVAPGAAGSSGLSIPA